MSSFIKTYKNTLKNREYSFLLSANTISRFGDAVHEIALIFIVFSLTNNPILMSFISIVSLIPNLFFGPIAGAFVDKKHKLKIMILSDIARGILVLFIPLVIYFKWFEIPVIFIVAFLCSIFETLSLPSQQALIPVFVDEEHLQSSNALFGLFARTGNILGNLIGSMFIGSMLILEAFYCDSFTFFISSILIVILMRQIKLQNKNFNFNTNLEKESLWKSVKDGLIEIKNNKIILTVLIVSLLLNIGGAPLIIILPFYLTDTLQVSAGYLGVAIAIMTGGIMAGSFLFGGIKIPKGKGFLGGAIGVGLTFIVLALFPLVISHFQLIVFFVLIFFNGLLISLANIFIPTIFQTYTPVELRGRIFAASRSTLAVGQPLSLAFSGVLINVLGPMLSFLVCGLLIFITSLCFLFNKHIRNM